MDFMKKSRRPSAKNDPFSTNPGANTYVSQCQICGLAVHTWEPHQFSTGKILGYVHIKCSESAECS